MGGWRRNQTEKHILELCFSKLSLHLHGLKGLEPSIGAVGLKRPHECISRLFPGWWRMLHQLL